MNLKQPIKVAGSGQFQVFASTPFDAGSALGVMAVLMFVRRPVRRDVAGLMRQYRRLRSAILQSGIRRVGV